MATLLALYNVLKYINGVSHNGVVGDKILL